MGSVCTVESYTEEKERYFILLFTENLQQPVLLIYYLSFKITKLSGHQPQNAHPEIGFKYSMRGNLF